MTLNARACEDYPKVAQAILDRGWEFNAHSYDQLAMHKVDDQKATIDKCMDVIEKFCGKRPRGWFGAGLTQTFDRVVINRTGCHEVVEEPIDDASAMQERRCRPARR